MNTYYTADPHFGHENIIKYCDRPFKSAAQMDKNLIRNWNEVVDKNDTCYILGDFSLRTNHFRDYYTSILSKLNGHKVLILGNHDDCSVDFYLKVGFQSVHSSLIVKWGNVDVLLIHDPTAAIVVPNMPVLCGHMHGLFRTIENVYNVGTDLHDYRPVSDAEILVRAYTTGNHKFYNLAKGLSNEDLSKNNEQAGKNTSKSFLGNYGKGRQLELPI